MTKVILSYEVRESVFHVDYDPDQPESLQVEVPDDLLIEFEEAKEALRKATIKIKALVTDPEQISYNF